MVFNPLVPMLRRVSVFSRTRVWGRALIASGPSRRKLGLRAKTRYGITFTIIALAKRVAKMCAGS